jgi:hypothetical protein
MRDEAAMFSNCPCVTNKDCQVRHHHASLIDENQDCGSGIQRLKQNGAVGPGLNVDDFRVSDQHGLKGLSSMTVDPAPNSSVTLGRACCLSARAGHIASPAATMARLTEKRFIRTPW